MATPYTLSDYLLDRLAEVGCKHVFGVPGDFAFPFLDHVVAHDDVAWVGTRSELAAAYAGDGYARQTGIGACTGSCGVLELGAAGGIAGAYSEWVPLLVVAGYPHTDRVADRVISHHSLRGDFSLIGLGVAPYTVGQVTVGPSNGARDIDHAIRTCIARRGPVLLRFPADVQELAATPPSTPLTIDFPASDKAQLAKFVAAAADVLRSAEKPAVLVDYLAGRHHVDDLVQRLCDHTKIPYGATTEGQPGMIDQSRPNYMGFYASPPYIGLANEALEGADALVRVCLAEGEQNRGLGDRRNRQDHFIDIDPESARIGNTACPRVAARDALIGLIEALEPREGLASAPIAQEAFEPAGAAKLTHDRFWDAFMSILEPTDTVTVDQGTSQVFKMLRMPVASRLMIQSSWMAMGWTTPAMLGAQLAAPDRRFLQVLGDGSMHENGQELSTIMARGLATITFVINNTTYQVENMTHAGGPTDMAYNDMPTWDYAAFARALGPRANPLALRVTTEEELADALKQAVAAQRAGRLSLIEVVVDRLDSSTVMQDFMGFNKAPGEGEPANAQRALHT